MRLDFSRLRARFSELTAARRRRQPWTVADLQAQRMLAVTVAPAAAGQRPAVLDASALEYEQALPATDALTAFAQQLPATRQRWALLLPRDAYRLAVMPEPEVPASELAQSVRWQLASTLDFPVEDAAVDFLRIPTRDVQPERSPELYVVAAPGETVRAQAAVFRAARLDLQAIDIRETAQRNLAALLEHDDELLVLVAFCADEVRISFNWRQELYMDRLIAERSVHDETPERRAAACERIRLQLQRSLEAVRANHPFMQAARIVVADAPEGFIELLGSTMFDPVEALDPEALFDLARTPQLREPRAFMQYFHALGVALRDREVAA